MTSPALKVIRFVGARIVATGRLPTLMLIELVGGGRHRRSAGSLHRELDPGGHCSPVAMLGSCQASAASRASDRHALRAVASGRARAPGRSSSATSRSMSSWRPARSTETGTDVPGRVSIRTGGSAANTARWLARHGVRTQLIGAVGRDGPGRALVDGAPGRRGDGTGRAGRRLRTARIGVLVDPSGERSFVADRGAAERSHRAISSRAGSPRSSTSICRPTRCSGSRSGWPVARRSAWRAPPGRSSVWTSPRRSAPGRRSGCGPRPGPLGGPRSAVRDRVGAPRPARLGGRTSCPGDGTRAAPIVVIKRGAAGVTVLARMTPVVARRRLVGQVRRRDPTAGGSRHDRDRRRVRCRVHRRMARVPGGRPVLAGGPAPRRRRGQPDRRSPGRRARAGSSSSADVPSVDVRRSTA